MVSYDAIIANPLSKIFLDLVFFGASLAVGLGLKIAVHKSADSAIGDDMHETAAGWISFIIIFICALGFLYVTRIFLACLDYSTGEEEAAEEGESL